MEDQAEELRNLVLRATRDNPIYAGPIPRLVVVSSGRAAMGTTTLALNMAVSLTEQGTRVVLLDADSHHADIATHCGLEPKAYLSDIASGRRSIHEVIAPGPAGLQIIPGSCQTEVEDSNSEGQQRLLSQVCSLGKHADTIVVDTGCSESALATRLWHHADHVLVVTTPEPTAVMDCYVTIKSRRETLVDSRTDVSLVVNQADDESVALDVYRRIDQSCKRFLQQSVSLIGYIPWDSAVGEIAPPSLPLVISRPSSPAALAIDAIAAKMMKQETERTRAAA